MVYLGVDIVGGGGEGERMRRRRGGGEGGGGREREMEGGGIEATPVQRRGGHECCLSDVVCLSKTVCLPVQDCLSKTVCPSAPQALPSLSQPLLSFSFLSPSPPTSHTAQGSATDSPGSPMRSGACVYTRNQARAKCTQ